MNSLLLTALLIAAAPPYQAQTLDGRTISGTLTGLSAERATLTTAKGPVDLPLDQLLLLAPKQAPKSVDAPGLTIELTDGSLLHAKQYQATAKEARITLHDGSVLTAPVDAVRIVRLQQGPAAAAAEWTRLTAMQPDSDMLIILNDEAVDYHKGVLGDVTEDVVHFNLEGETLPVKRTKLLGFVRHQAKDASQPASIGRLTDASGSKWAVKTISLGKNLEWTTPTGLKASAPLDAIVQLDVSGGKLVYLSDLKPERQVWTPYFAGAKTPPALQEFYGPRFNRGFQSATLRLGGEDHSKGMALHSRTELVYRLPERFARFKATVGIDDAVRPRGKARLIVRGDDRVLFDSQLAGTDSTRELDLDMTDVRRLTIVVDFVGTPPVDDCLLICEARMLK